MSCLMGVKQLRISLCKKVANMSLYCQNVFSLCVWKKYCMKK